MNDPRTYQFHIRPCGMSFSSSKFCELMNFENPEIILAQLDDLIIYSRGNEKPTPCENTPSPIPEISKRANMQ